MYSSRRSKVSSTVTRPSARRYDLLAALGGVVSLAGCGASAAPELARASLSGAGVASLPSDAPVGAEPTAPRGDVSTVHASLPEAPWTATPIEPEHAAPAFVDAWRRADNRLDCAPLAPAALGAGEGARARSGALDGGWMVEFDKPGTRGLAVTGAPCVRCGRSAFGVAGTAMTPDEVSEDPTSDPAPVYRDGSRAAWFMPEGAGEAASATLVVEGQGCVYQVWSFLGADHVRALVGELRLVDVGRAERIASSNAGSPDAR